MKILITGDREWSDYAMVHAALLLIKSTTSDPITVIDGGCRGADDCGYNAAKALGLNTVRHFADWKQHGKAAGPIRNQQMIDLEAPDLSLVFHDNLKQSRGTKDMINRLKHHNIRYVHFKHESL